MKHALKRPFANIKYAKKGMSYKDYLEKNQDQLKYSDIEFDSLCKVKKGFNYSD
jgi:hypothetical protein